MTTISLSKLHFGTMHFDNSEQAEVFVRDFELLATRNIVIE